MYETFFSMKHTPFIRSIPTDMLYSDSETDEIQNRLVYASDRQLFATLVGDSGCGKTTALRRLHETLSGKGYTVLYVTESKLTPRNFYNNLLEQMGTEGRFYRGDSRKLLYRQIEMLRGLDKKKLVVIVDEAHLLDKEMLEEIRFLLNYRMDSENPLALILSGQSDLWDRMKTQAYRAIRYRIDVECFMELFDCSQTEAYIAKQLHYAGGNEQIFSDSALKKIYDYSSGLPRMINRACTLSLSLAYQTNRLIVDDRMVGEALEEEVT